MRESKTIPIIRWANTARSSSGDQRVGVCCWYPSPSEAKTFASSVLEPRHVVNPPSMKKKTADSDELRPEYPKEFFQSMKPNRFAGGGERRVILDADVAAVFD